MRAGSLEGSDGRWSRVDWPASESRCHTQADTRFRPVFRRVERGRRRAGVTPRPARCAFATRGHPFHAKRSFARNGIPKRSLGTRAEHLSLILQCYVIRFHEHRLRLRVQRQTTVTKWQSLLSSAKMVRRHVFQVMRSMGRVVLTPGPHSRLESTMQMDQTTRCRNRKLPL